MPIAFGKAPALSEEEKRFQQDQLNELELIKLRREYDVLARERNIYQLLGSRKLTKATAIVDIFKHEYENILADLAVATGPIKKNNDTIQFDVLVQLLHEYDLSNEQVNTQKTYIVEVEGQIKKVKKNVQALTKQQVTDRQYEIALHAARQTYETLENKLEVQMKMFNMILTKNAQLREVMDHHLWDRRNFMAIWKKFIDRLNTGKHIMLDLIEQASICYDQREDLCTRLQMLRISGHRDLLHNVDHMRACEMKLDDAKKREQFYIIKGQKRIMQDLMEKEKLKRMEQKKNLQEKLEIYDHMLCDIEAFTRQSQTKVVAKKYYQREAQNFTNYKYIIQMIQEMELHNDNLGVLLLEIDERRRVHDVRRTQQNNCLDDLEADLTAALQVSQQAEEDLAVLLSELDAIMSGTWNLFKICRCDQNPLLQLLGNNSTIKEYNVLLYLQILEKQIHESLIRAGYKNKLLIDKKPTSKQRIFTEEKVSTAIYGIDKIVHTHPCSLCVEHEMVSDVIDVAQRPWNRKQVAENLKVRLSQPGALAVIHTISKCHLPKARRVIQQRYE